MTNGKLRGTGLTECPEVEQLRPCAFFGQGLCPSCYALPLLKLRRRNSRHVHKRTPTRGLIRLGTYKEVTPDEWRSFKEGRGRWDCCGEEWTRIDFPTRPYFVITRGLADEAFYRALADDSRCVNVQVSVDILPSGRVVPDESRLAVLVALPKVILRFKTTLANARAFVALAGRLGIQRERVMETPLRDGAFAYGKDTPLQKLGWSWQTFGRCNSTCRDCVKENGVLLCAARPAHLARLVGKERPTPPRHSLDPHAIEWVVEVQRALAARGGEATVQEVYAHFLAAWPELDAAKGSWRFKVRVAIQRVGVMVERGRWRLPNRALIPAQSLLVPLVEQGEV